MAATRVQTKSGNAGGYTVALAITMDSNVVAGNTLILWFFHFANVVSVADSLGNTYNLVQEGATIYARGSLYYSNITVSGPCVITVTFAGYTDPAYIAREYSGLLSPAVDVSAENVETGYVSSHPCGTTASTAQANNLVVIGYAGNDQPNNYAAAGFSNLVSVNGSDSYPSAAFADKDVSSISTQTGTFTSTGFYMFGYGAIAVFKEASAVSNLIKSVITTAWNSIKRFGPTARANIKKVGPSTT